MKTNPEGIRRMKEEAKWLRENARYAVGAFVAFHASTFHVANGCRAKLVALRMNHSHPSGHTEACWRPNDIVYVLAFGHDEATDRAYLRWNASRFEISNPDEHCKGRGDGCGLFIQD
jgi:hypothetical protein